MTANKHIHITESSLKSLRRRDKPWFLKDTKISGFQIKINPSGKSSYFVEARLGGTGKVKRFKLGNVFDLTLADARILATENLALIRAGQDPQALKRARIYEGMLLHELLDSYLKHAQSRDYKARTISDYRRHFKKHFSKWKNKRVQDLSKHEILDWYSAGYKTPTDTDNAFRCLNAVLNYAVGLEVIELNPCTLINKTRARYKRNERTRHLELDGNLGRFLTAFIQFDYQKDSQKTARDIILLMLTSGLRFDEARKIRFSDVDLKLANPKVFIPDTKNRRDHYVPLVPLTFTMFRYRKEKYRDTNSDYVFRIKGGRTKSPYVTDIRKTINGICDSAAIDRISSHDFRRTFSTVLNEVGVGFADVQALMNHKSKNVTLMYVQNNLPKLRQHIEKVVKFYDQQIVIAENPSNGWSETGTNVIQSSLYNNVEAEFDPLVEDMLPNKLLDCQTRDYWYGNLGS